MAKRTLPQKKSRSDKIETANKAIELIKDVGETEDYLKMLVYGRGGMGKTTFGASGARIAGLRTLVIDFNEQGTVSIKRHKNTKVARVEYWEELDWIYWYLKVKKHDFQVVVLDTVSSMAVLGMKWVLGDENSRDGSRDPMMPDKRHWGKLGELMKTQIWNFRNLPMHVVFTAHERTSVEQDEEENTLVEVVPSISPAPRETLIGAVHVVGRIYTRPVTVQDQKTGKKKEITERRMLIGPDAKYVSKIRLDPESPIQPPRVVRKPTLPYFIDTILPALEPIEE